MEMIINTRELSRRLIDKICRERSVGDLMYLTRYTGDAELELGGAGVVNILFETAMDGMSSLVCLQYGDVSYALFSISVDFSAYRLEHPDEKRVREELSVLEGKIKGVFREVMEEYLCCLWSQKEEDKVRYKILNMSNVLAFAKDKIFECGDYILPQCTDVVHEGECYISSNAMFDIIKHYHDMTGFVAEIGWVVVYQKNGDSSIHAMVIEKVALCVPSLSNKGVALLLCEGKEIPAFNYTMDSVANREFVFLISDNKVVNVDLLDLDGLYLAAELSWELDEWRVIYNAENCADYFSVATYYDFEEARHGVSCMINVQKKAEAWMNKTVKEVSPFGLESIIEKKRWKKWHKPDDMSVEELLDALKLEDGLEITGNPKKLARFFEALGIVVGMMEERLVEEKKLES